MLHPHPIFWSVVSGEGVLFDVVGHSIFVAGTIQTSVVALGTIVIVYSLQYSMPSKSEGALGLLFVDLPFRSRTRA